MMPMRQAALGAALAVAISTVACSSHDEVQRVTSPDGKVDAILFEENCGAVCTYWYEVRLEAKGSWFDYKVALLESATRNDQAWGVNLRWSDSYNLNVEYFRAEDASLKKKTLVIAGDRIAVSLHNGVSDAQAPPGSMMYNLRGRPYDKSVGSSSLQK